MDLVWRQGQQSKGFPASWSDHVSLQQPSRPVLRTHLLSPGSRARPRLETWAGITLARVWARPTQSPAHPQLWEGKSEPPRRPGARGLLASHAHPTSTPGVGNVSPDQGFSRALSEKKKKIKAHLKTRKEKRTLVLHIMDEYEPRIHEAVSNVLKIKPKDGTRIYRSMKKNICVDFFYH